MQASTANESSKVKQAKVGLGAPSLTLMLICSAVEIGAAQDFVVIRSKPTPLNFALRGWAEWHLVVRRVTNLERVRNHNARSPIAQHPNQDIRSHMGAIDL